MAEGEPAESGGRAFRLFGWRRKSREEREPEPCCGAGIRKNSRSESLRHRRPRRRLYGESRRRLRHHPDRESAERHAAHGSVSGRRVAPAGIASSAESVRNEMGIDQVMKAVFLDRDGVINRAVVRDGKPHPPDSIEELEVLAGVPDALLKLRDAGFRLIVVTNQPDVARGTQTREAIEAMHVDLMSTLPVDDVVTCYHDDDDACDCRKPKPGALVDAANRHGVELKRSFMVGDRWRDIEAGQRAGCRCLFVDRGYAEQQPAGSFVRVPSLAAAAEWILSNQ